MKRTLTVLGKPKPQGSMRAFLPKGGKFPVTVSADQGVYKYRADIQSAFKRKYDDPMPLKGPIVLHCVFLFRRPDSHFMPVSPRKGRAAREELRATAPVMHHLSTPDVDKLVRAVGDALTGFAFVDDKQVSDLWANKRWGDADMTIIDILTPEQDMEDAKNGL